MKKVPLYSRSRRSPAPDPIAEAPPPQAAPAAEAEGAAAPRRDAKPGRWAALKRRAAAHERKLWLLGALLLFGAALAWKSGPAVRPPLTIEQIDYLMRKSIDEKPLASAAAHAYQKIIPSVVRVVGFTHETDDKPSPADKAPENKVPQEKKALTGKGPEVDKDGFVERGVGTGVVIVDNGTILTNLHVVIGAERVKVTFMDGLESTAKVVSVMPEHDLAVLRADKIPDDLIAATMRSTGDLAPGDRVMAVGFPFGIGPSASEGVVSGLKREFRSPEGEKALTNLIQFDAAANPGNSGGPLITMEGEVVGVVTAILNPSKQRVFIGIGFAVPIENAAQGAGLPPF